MPASESTFSWKPLSLLLGLILLTAGLITQVHVRVGQVSGIHEFLPDTLGAEWTGDQVLFCQNPLCGRSWLTRDISEEDDGTRVCTTNWQGEPCGSELLTMSYGERMILPSDTKILKKRYTRNYDPEEIVFCSVVFSGEHRTSIHRPETCMVGQGHEIVSNPVIEVPLEGREPLRVMVLHLTKRVSPQRVHNSYYAYWFVGDDRETPFHHERMLWMALDRIFKNITHRWAYIAVSGERSPDLNDTAHYEEIREVVGKLYPQISLVDPS